MLHVYITDIKHIDTLWQEWWSVHMTHNNCLKSTTVSVQLYKNHRRILFNSSESVHDRIKKIFFKLKHYKLCTVQNALCRTVLKKCNCSNKTPSRISEEKQRFNTDNGSDRWRKHAKPVQSSLKVTFVTMFYHQSKITSYMYFIRD